MNDSDDEAVKRLKDAALALGEHFDSVQIIVTHYVPGADDKETKHFHFGTGNWYARYASAIEWLELGRQAMRPEPEEEA